MLFRSDTSIFSPKYWWTDDGKTVWNAIQEICRDSQMTAIMDENNVLQFYTRDYFFDNSKNSVWTFRYDPDGNNLANIIAFSKQDIATANVIKVLWNAQAGSEQIGNAQPLWKSEDSFMGAFALDQNLYSNVGAGGSLKVSAVVVNQYEKEVIYSLSGYLVIDSEIIEYDAIEYQYLSKSTNAIKTFWATNSYDVQKIISDVQPSANPDYILKQSGNVRIKTRGAFGTTVTDHFANAQDILTSWNGNEVGWGS